MNLFQWTTLLFIASYLGYNIYQLRKSPFLKILFGIRGSLALLAAFVVIIHPSISQGLAHYFGITRGADFILYISILWLVHRNSQATKKLDELESKIDQLNRDNSLR